MSVQCPVCGWPIPEREVTRSTNTAFCRACNEVSLLSAGADPEVGLEELIRDPPEGAWFLEDDERIVVGGRLRRDWGLLHLAGGLFGLGILAVIAAQVPHGMLPILLVFFAIPLAGALGSVLLGPVFLWGRQEVIISHESRVFLAIGRIGWSRRLNWRAVDVVREEIPRWPYNKYEHRRIVLDGKPTIRLGLGLRDESRDFVRKVLTVLLEERP